MKHTFVSPPGKKYMPYHDTSSECHFAKRYHEAFLQATIGEMRQANLKTSTYVHAIYSLHSPASQNIQCAAAVIMSILTSLFTPCRSIVTSQIKVIHTKI